MLKNKNDRVEQNVNFSSEDSKFEESDFEKVGDTSSDSSDDSIERNKSKALSREIELEIKNISNVAISLSSKNENLQSNQNNAKGLKRKNNGCSFLSIKNKRKEHKTAPISHHHNDPLNMLNKASYNQHYSNPQTDGIMKFLNLKEDECKGIKESKREKVFNCGLPGCSKIFRKQKTYETHIKHFHGVFKFKKSYPIITASFYDCKKKISVQLDPKSSAILKNRNTEKSDNEKSRSANKCVPPTPLWQNGKLPSKFSDSDILLPSSLLRGIEAVSVGKKVAEVIYEDYYQKKILSGKPHKDLSSNKSACIDKINSNFESNNTSSVSSEKAKTNLNFYSNVQTLFSTEKSDNIKLVSDNKSQNSSSRKTMLVDDTEYILPHNLSNTSDNLNTKIAQGNENFETFQGIISDMRNIIQEEHLYASKELYRSYEEFVNQKGDEFHKKDSFFELSNNKDEVKDISKNNKKLNSDSDIEYAVLPKPSIESSKDEYSYEEFVKKKEMECVDLDSSLQNKVSMLEEINKKKNITGQDKIGNVSKAVSLALSSSFDSINNLKSSISKNANTVNGKNVDYIRRSFELCNHARNLRQILLKCKQLLDSLGNYVMSKNKNIDENITLLDPNIAKHCTVEEKTTKLLHYVFFLDVLRDSAFTSIYIPHILTKTEVGVLNKLHNPVSLYLTNTEMELPNVKLRRDREFLQRNSDFFNILLKIQKSCYILPYARSSVSVEDLYRPPTKLRLEKSDYFAQVFSDIKTKKGHIFMQSYGADKDLSTSPFIECVCDDYFVHKLSGFVLLPRPDCSVSKDMCVGLCFESTSLSLKDCIFELSSVAEEIKKNLSDVRTELLEENAEYGATEMRDNLLDIFDLIGTEAKSAFSSLNLISHYINKLPEKDKDNYLGEIEKELTKDSMREIGRIVEDLQDLKECDSLL